MFTVLMPAANDDYSLSLSIPAIAPFVDEVLVYVDAAEDRTNDVLDGLLGRFGNLRVVRGKERIGWCESRNQLMQLTNSDHLLFIDADDIFCEWQVGLLHALPEIAKQEDSGYVMLGLQEAVGDFDHGTGRGWSRPHYDKCHAYVNRAACRDLEWRWKNTFTYPHTSDKRSVCDSVLFVHAKSVKSDNRLVWRDRVRLYTRSKMDLHYGADEPKESHDQALHVLFHNSQNPLKRRPASVKIPASLKHRFEVTYSGSRPIDRIDHGWEP